jgi:hypothetical protein
MDLILNDTHRNLQPKRRRSSAQPTLGGPSRKIIPQQPALAEESEQDEDIELPARKVGRSKKSVRLSLPSRMKAKYIASLKQPAPKHAAYRMARMTVVGKIIIFSNLERNLHPPYDLLQLDPAHLGNHLGRANLENHCLPRLS